MQDLIFIGIIAVFIAGMLWSDRDSRQWRFGEPFPPWSATREVLKMLREYEESDEMRLKRIAIMQAQIQGFGENTPYLMDILNRDPATFKEQKTIMLSTPTGSIFYDQAVDRARRDKESNWNTDKQDPIKDINDMATECGWPTIPTESEEQ